MTDLPAFKPASPRKAYFATDGDDAAEDFLDLDDYPHLNTLAGAGDGELPAAAPPAAGIVWYRPPSDRPVGTPHSFAPFRDLGDEIAVRVYQQDCYQRIATLERLSQGTSAGTREIAAGAIAMLRAEIREIGERLEEYGIPFAGSGAPQTVEEYETQLDARAQDLLKTDAELIELAKTDSYKAYIRALEQAERALSPSTSAEATDE